FSFRKLCPNVPCVIDLHNVYSQLVERASEEQPSVFARAYLKHEARLLAKMERQAVLAADAVCAVSKQDEQYFAQISNQQVHVVPKGVDCNAYHKLPTGRGQCEPRILYLGDLSWEPNVAAAHYLATQVMPRILDCAPNTKLLIVGRNPA